MLRGINYDTGFGGLVGDRSRVAFDPAVVRRELEVIATDLHCDAVRVSGDDPDRLVVAANAAIDAGLRVWFSPFPMDLAPPEHRVRARRVLVRAVPHRVGPSAWANFAPEWDFTAVPHDIVAVARQHFDFAAVDLYRSASNAAGFRSHVRRHLGHGKPLVVTEFGCRTHRGGRTRAA